MGSQTALPSEHTRIGHEPPGSLPALRPLVPLFCFSTKYVDYKKKKKKLEKKKKKKTTAAKGYGV
jgi:hypothetical protein